MRGEETIGCCNNVDSQMLLSAIRQRETIIIFTLQSIHHSPTTNNFKSECKEMKIKQNQLNTFIKQIIISFNNMPISTQTTETHFWQKLKSIVKLSLERVKTLNFLSSALFDKYEAIIDQINNSIDLKVPITEYRFIQDLLKAKNKCLITSLAQKFILSDSKNYVKKSNYFQNEACTNYKSKQYPLQKHIRQSSSNRKLLIQRRRPKSHCVRIGIKKEYDNKELKRTTRINPQSIFQKTINEVMEATVDFNFDNKKSINNLKTQLLQRLKQRNSTNEKIINNYKLSQCGISSKSPNKSNKRNINIDKFQNKADQNQISKAIRKKSKKIHFLSKSHRAIKQSTDPQIFQKRKENFSIRKFRLKKLL